MHLLVEIVLLRLVQWFRLWRRLLFFYIVHRALTGKDGVGEPSS